MDVVATTAGPSVIAPAAVDDLIRVLAERGYTVIGPTVRDGAVVFDEVHAVADLPVGQGDEQEAGTYRITDRGDGALFGYAVGPGSLRRFISPPHRRLWSATYADGHLDVQEEPPPAERFAFIGARPCDLAAAAVLGRVLGGGNGADTAFVVAVSCGAPAPTCFCSSMGTGPDATEGYDLALTEILDERHRLLVDVGTERGADLLEALPRAPAGDDDVEAARRVTGTATDRMRRALDPAVARDALAGHLEHPRWDDVAARCLSCANCTLVCPTCFCHTVEDVTSIDGRRAERVQRWDSCFTLDHSYLHGGGPVRADIRSRYRQWLTHKLSTWWDQFGESGCVGCGRCITWCPAAIDLTEEVAAIAGGHGEGDG